MKWGSLSQVELRIEKAHFCRDSDLQYHRSAWFECATLAAVLQVLSSAYLHGRISGYHWIDTFFSRVLVFEA
jgi:hypothetical protein